MKFIPKKSRFFYALLLVSLLFPVVAPDRLTPKASAIELLSLSWGLGAVTWAGPAVTAALASFFLVDKASTNKNNSTAANSQQTEYYLETPDRVGVRSVPSQQIDASFQHNYPLSSNDAIDCMKGLLIGGKSVANMYKHFTIETTPSSNTYSQSEYVSQHNKMNEKGFLGCAYEHVRDIKNHYKRILAGEDLITTEDFSKRGCRNWTVGDYKRHLIYKYRLYSPDCRSNAGFDQVLPEKLRRSLFCDLALYKRPGYVKFLATLTCPHDLQRALIFEERLYKHAHVIELYKTFDGFKEYLPILLDQASIESNTNLGGKVRDICMKKIEVTEHDRVAQHEVYQQKMVTQTEAKVLALQKYNPKLLDRWTKVGAVCSDFVELFNGDFFRPGKWYKVSQTIRNMAQGHGVTVGRKILQSDTLESRLQVGILTLLEEVNTFYNKNKHNPTIQLVVPYIEKFLVHALSHANENNLDSSFGLFNCGFVTFKVLTGSQSDGLSYGVGSLLPDQVKRDIRSLYCLYPCALFEKLVGALGDFNDSYQACAESLGVIGPDTPQKATLVRDINEHVKKNGLWDSSMTAEERAAFDIREVMRNDLKLMGVYETAHEEAMRKHQHTTTDPPSHLYEDCKKHIIEPVDEAPSQEREPTAAELIAERDAQKALQQKQQMLQQPVTSIVHPKSADCTQKTDSSQTSQSSNTTQEIQKTDSQTDSQSVQAAHELQQAVYTQAASGYQKGLDLYGDKLTDSQRTRYENRRDAFLEVYNNPDQTFEYNYTLPVESQRMLQAAGINISQFMSGSGNTLERLVHHEQHQIAGKLQEYALQIPKKKRNGVLREMLSNMRHASALQQCGLHQLSLIPIDQNWMLIDSIDQFGFGILDQLPEQYGLGCFVYNVAYGCFVKGPVNAANLIYLTVSNIPATIEAAGKLVEDKNAAIDLLCTSVTKKVGSATLTLLACGVPESALKDQMGHWSEQQRTEAAACIEDARKRLKSIANNPISTTIHAIGNHLVHDAADAGVATYNILYGLSCMEAACETLDKDLEIKLFAQGEQLLQENLPTAKQTAEFAGEMLFWHYGPGLIKKGASAAYDKLAERFVRGVEQVPRLMKHKVRYLTDAEFQVLASKPLSEAVEVTILADNTIVVTEAEAAASAATNSTAAKQAAKTAEIVLAEEASGLVSTTKTVLGDEASGVVEAAKKIALSEVAESAQEIVSAVEKVTEENGASGLGDVLSKETIKSSEIDVATKNEVPAATGMTEDAEFVCAPSATGDSSSVSQKKVPDKSVASQMTPSGPKVSFAESKMIERCRHLVDESGKQIHETITKVRVKEIPEEHSAFFEEQNRLIKEAILEDTQLLETVKEITKEITATDGIVLTGKFNMQHLCIPKAKGQSISGYHWPCMATESILEVEWVFPNSLEAKIGVIKGSGNCAQDPKSLFLPGTTAEEIKEFLLMTLKYPELAESVRGGVYLFSKLINGQRYAACINHGGNITTFHPYNRELPF